ncbi:hypothetical protein BV898_16751 [Hypsibius exemplaris]|uniref:G-protein coupled receptors family 1 profile domain-containing protein n=1 Tax=Hypsibius exemplaris TaxID=2072580 RepID=A0A9X6RLE7_HYPEX|nr:hypothetical protein BV898_16751 [Hypsibius exemplaris]
MQRPQNFTLENATISGSNTTVSINSTESLTTATWSPASVISSVLLVTGMAGNLILLYGFSRDRVTLITPFNVYIVNLLLADLLDILFQYPFDIVNGLYPRWDLGERLCTVYMYGVWVGGAATTNAHLLIAVNRIWAVSWPHSYHHRHSIRTATVICCAMWLLAYVTVWPWVILDALFYRLPVETNGCMVNQPGQFIYSCFVEIGVYDCPNAVILMVLPVVMRTMWLRKRWQRRPRPATMRLKMTDFAIRGGHVASSSATQPRTNMSRSREALSAPGNTATDGPAASGSLPASRADAVMRRPSRRNRERSNGNLVLIVLTCSMLVTYTATNAIYTASVFVVDYDWMTLFVVANVLWSLQPTINSISFVATIPDLRKAVFAMFH